MLSVTAPGGSSGEHSGEQGSGRSPEMRMVPTVAGAGRSAW
jgi:hypothetical protein